MRERWSQNSSCMGPLNGKITIILKGGLETEHDVLIGSSFFWDRARGWDLIPPIPSLKGYKYKFRSPSSSALGTLKGGC